MNYEIGVKIADNELRFQKGTLRLSGTFFGAVLQEYLYNDDSGRPVESFGLLPRISLIVF